MKHLKKLGIITLLLTLVGFTILQITQEDKGLIIGTWIPEGSPSLRWVFESGNVLKKSESGKIYKTYQYTIKEETSDDGRLKFSTLKIINMNDLNDTYTYDINGLNETIMYLNYQGNMNTSLLKYTRQ